MLLTDWKTLPVWPDAAGRALLRAALASDADFPAAWGEAREVFRIDTATLGHQRLLPLIYQKMVDGEIDDPWRERFKGVYRNTWVVNQRVFRLARLAAELLESAGVPVLVIKGLALAHHCYGNPTLRPMEDCDLLVREADASCAIEALQKAGWQAGYGGRWWDALRPVRHAMDLTPDGATHLDLHWHYLPGAVCNRYEQALWQAAGPVSFLSREWRMPGNEDQFVHALVHGMQRNPVATFRWAVDAAMLLNASPPFDWNVVVQRSRQLRLPVPVREALRFLDNELGVSVPREVGELLDAETVSSKDIEAFHFWAGAGVKQSPIREFREEYRRAARLVPRWQTRRRWRVWKGLIMLQTRREKLLPALADHLRWRGRAGWKHSAARALLKAWRRSGKDLTKRIRHRLKKKRNDFGRKWSRYANQLRQWWRGASPPPG